MIVIMTTTIKMLIIFRTIGIELTKSNKTPNRNREQIKNRFKLNLKKESGFWIYESCINDYKHAFLITTTKIN